MTEVQTSARRRTRSRVLDTESTEVAAAPQFDRRFAEGEAETYYNDNLAKNKLGKSAGEARKILYRHLKDTHARPFTFSAEGPDGNPVQLRVSVDTPSGEVVDIDKLRALVTDAKTLNRIITATQAAVEKHAGKAILRQVLVSTTGQESVNVKVVKEGRA